MQKTKKIHFIKYLMSTCNNIKIILKNIKQKIQYF